MAEQVGALVSGREASSPQRAADDFGNGTRIGEGGVRSLRPDEDATRGARRASLSQIDGQSATDISQELITSLWIDQCDRLRRLKRGFSRFQALRRPPLKVRGKKRHSVSPRRAEAGSACVAARGWCQLL